MREQFLHWLSDHRLLDVPFGKHLLLAFFCIIVLYGVWQLLIWLGKSTWRGWVSLLTEKGNVAWVASHVDGDTVKVKLRWQEGEKPISVRLIGIDTPESRKSMYMRPAPFGKRSAAYTRKRLPKGQKILLRFDQEKEDKFQRLLAYIYLPDGEFFNATLVKQGYAWADPHPPNTRHAETFTDLQKNAKRYRRGLWKIYTEPNELRQNYLSSKEYDEFLKTQGR